MNPWFQQWPQNVDSRRGAIRPGPVVPKRPMKTVAAFIRDGNYPAKFAQLLPFDTGNIQPNQEAQIAITLDEDFPFRMDSVQAIASGFAGAASFCEVSIELPSGRKLTREPVALSTICGNQGGKSFVHFRYRFRPSEIIQVTVRNVGAAPLRFSGVVYGYKLTSESRL